MRGVSPGEALSLNAAIEFHDSELDEIAHEASGIVVRFAPAYVHRSAGEPGVDDGMGGWQACALFFAGGKVRGGMATCLPTSRAASSGSAERSTRGCFPFRSPRRTPPSST